MGKTFFVDWELWQKMTFILACLLVATIIIGLIKLQFDKRKLRNYAKVAQKQAAQTPEMLEAQPVKKEEDKDLIPFGIRAIESGIEIDGVWISRSNTPVGSSRSSFTEPKLSKSNNSSQLELPKAVRGSSSRASSFDRAVSAERLPTNGSRSSSPGRENPTNTRGRPPVSYARYSNSNYQRNSTTLQALEGLDPRLSSTRYEPNSTQASSSSNSANSSIRTSDESDYMQLQEGRPFEPAYINPNRASLAVPVDPRWDLDLLQSHRLSHVAETGQLTPRTRRPGNSGEWASVAENMRSPQDISTTNGVEYFAPRQKTPSPPLPAVPDFPAHLPASLSSRRTQDGHASNQAKQSVPLLETYEPQPTYAPQAYQPRGPQHAYDDEEAHAVTTFENARKSQVLRKVNSGFEILRPGTLGEPPSAEEPMTDRRQSKRLQKKRRQSNGSATSRFVEQV